ncbi:discoidin domain-containing protein [Nocardia sp. NPDC052254]|uniref:discoidin domain-containing protein n=1 Tax=Nocardia sp. NPDC052254 TaxID=3155681 RepID=UPI003444C72F
MPEDQGDVFLRHRGAVLDALLSDPSFGPPEVEPTSGPATSASSSSVDSVAALPDPDSVPSARRVDSGPKASDRIMALLSGESAASPAQMDFASDFSERSSRLGASSGAGEQSAPGESGPREQAAKPAPGERADLPQQILTQVRKPKVALTIAGVLAVVLVLVLITTSGKDEKTQPLAVVTPVSAAPAPPSKSEAPEASSSVIKPKSAQAKCSAGSTDAMNAFSGEPGKAWSCVRSFKIDGQVMTIDLGKSYQVDSIGIVPGFDSVGSDGSDQWSKFRTVSRVSYEFNDPTQKKYTQQTLDQRSLVVTKIDPAVNASKVTLTVQQSEGDRSVNATAISSIVITGH